MLISSGGQLKCRKCGYIRKIETADKMTTKKMRKEKEIMIVDDEDEDIKTMPTTRSNAQVREQSCDLVAPPVRAADESEVRFFQVHGMRAYLAQYD